jgi:hypothetical protein
VDEQFDAPKFVEEFDQGLFDGRVSEELTKLTQGQLAEVAVLLAARIKARIEDYS